MAVVIASAFLLGLRPLKWRLPEASATGPLLKLTIPPSGPFPQGEHYIEKGKIEVVPPIVDFGARSKTISFDLNDDWHERFLAASMTRNARIWEESRHGIRYWGPINDREWFDVVYRIPFDFPVRAASLYASLNVADADASGILEVSADPVAGWTRITSGTTMCPCGGPIDISKHARGARLIYVRAHMKGRDDGEASAMAQFLRTSTLPDGHIDKKSPYVFELRAYDREVPILTGTVQFSDTCNSRLWIASDGVFWLDRVFDKPGEYWGTIEVRASPLAAVSKTLHIACTPARLALSHPKP
jgi:hypothetical protein